MAWRDELRPASFRGVPFYIEGHESTYGRRRVTHVYPFRDLPFTEDLGRRARGYEVAAFLIGEDYFRDREALRAAVETPGPGVLVHPYLGSVAVEATLLRIRETTREGGVARLSISFVEAGENRLPAALAPFLGADVVDAAKAAIGAIRDGLATVFTVLEAPSFVVAEAATIIRQTGAELLLALGVSRATGDAVAAFARDVDGLTARADFVAGGPPEDMASEVVGLVDELGELEGDPESHFEAMLGLSIFGDDLESPPTTPASRAKQAANQVALTGAVRRAAVAGAARLVPTLPFAAVSEALEVRDRIVAALDREILAAADEGLDEESDELRDLLAVTVRDLTARSANLSRVTSLTPQATLPALVLAHDLYGDATRAEEIVSRNRVLHPGFVPGGVTLELLTDG